MTLLDYLTNRLSGHKDLEDIKRMQGIYIEHLDDGYVLDSIRTRLNIHKVLNLSLNLAYTTLTIASIHGLGLEKKEYCGAFIFTLLSEFGRSYSTEMLKKIRTQKFEKFCKGKFPISKDKETLKDYQEPRSPKENPFEERKPWENDPNFWKE